MHIWSFNAYYNYFVAIALWAVPIDNKTRWNSWYKIILVALELRVAIGKYQKEYINKFNKEDILNTTNWKALESIRDFL